MFGVIWKFIQLFLDPVTREKYAVTFPLGFLRLIHLFDRVQIFSHTPHDVLLKYIPEDQIPVEYGGHGGSCYPTVRRGGVVPKTWVDEFHDSFTG